jgi:hypothetical protein
MCRYSSGMHSSWCPLLAQAHVRNQMTSDIEDIAPRPSDWIYLHTRKLWKAIAAGSEDMAGRVDKARSVEAASSVDTATSS